MLSDCSLRPQEVRCHRMRSDDGPSRLCDCPGRLCGSDLLGTQVQSERRGQVHHWSCRHRQGERKDLPSGIGLGDSRRSSVIQASLWLTQQERGIQC